MYLTCPTDTDNAKDCSKSSGITDIDQYPSCYYSSNTVLNNGYIFIASNCVAGENSYESLYGILCNSDGSAITDAVWGIYTTVKENY